MNSNYELAHKEIIRDYLRTTNRQTKAKKIHKVTAAHKSYIKYNESKEV